MEWRENWPISSSPTFPIYFVLTPHRLKATMAVATWPPPCLENRSISIFVLTVGNCGTTLRKSTELRPIPTTSKGLSFGKGRLNRMSIFYKLLINFSSFSERPLIDVRGSFLFTTQDIYDILVT